jgi:membrane protease YdiL (CAAX protease family)
MVLNESTLPSLPLPSRRKQFQLFLLGWLGILIGAIFIGLIVVLISRLILPTEAAALFINSPFFFTLINFLSYAILFVLGIIILFPWLRLTFIPSFISGKWLIGIPFTFVILISTYLITAIYQAFDLSIASNQNQTAIVSLVNESPIISLITFALLGPIVEEWTYRLGLFQWLKVKNRWLAYGLTLTLFGLIHFDYSNIGSLNEWLNLPIYLIAGGWFCYLYDRFGLGVAMAAHITNNLLSIISIIVIGTESSSISL